MQRILVSLFAILLLVSTACPQDVPLRTAADRSVDVVHLKLELDVSLEEKHVRGSATIDFTPRHALRVLTLDAVEHGIGRVRFAAGDAEPAPLEHDYDGARLSITFPRPLERGDKGRLIVDYEVNDPKSGLHFFGPSEADANVPLQVWSQGEPTTNRFWFPCVDNPNERQSTEIVATVDAGLEVLSNGRLVSREAVDGGRVRFHWFQKQPHVSYLVTLVVGEFAVAREEWRGRPVLYYVPADRADETAPTFGRTLKMLDFFSARFGIEYPWEKYAQVVVEQFTAGGMENTSATTLYEGTLHDQRAFLDGTPDWLIAHELGHQWWGDLVTCKDWSHLWLNEGFATYCEVLWAEHHLGPDARDYRLYDKSRSARRGSALSRPIVDRRYPNPGSMFDTRAYPKGCWVLHMLRSRLGDEDFFRALKRYGTVYAYQTAETSDLRQIFERLTGYNLERFFYDWTERPGHPILSVASSYEAEDRLAKLVVKQEQEQDAFNFPLKIELICPHKPPVVIEKEIEEEELTFYVPVPGRPEQVRVDPGFTLLAEIKEQKSRDLWARQALDAPTVPERLRAVEHFAGNKQKKDVELLARVLAEDAFYGIRVEAAEALGKSGGDAARDALIAGLGQDDARVREACAKALGQFAEDETAERAVRDALADGEESYATTAALLASLAKIPREPSLEHFERALSRESHREVIRRAALSALAESEDPRALELLKEWTAKGKPQRARRAAIAGLAEFANGNGMAAPKIDQLVELLSGLLKGEVPQIRQSAIDALGRLGKPARAALPLLEAIAEHESERRVQAAAEQTVKRIEEAALPPEQLRALRQQVEQLEKDKRELQERLQKLEAK